MPLIVVLVEGMTPGAPVGCLDFGEPDCAKPTLEQASAVTIELMQIIRVMAFDKFNGTVSLWNIVDAPCAVNLLCSQRAQLRLQNLACCVSRQSWKHAHLAWHFVVG